MSPPTNGRFRSSPSSTGTVPKSNSTMNGDRSRSTEPQANASYQSNLRHQSLERMLKEQQAKLRSLEASQQQNNQTDSLAENLAELSEKLRILQSANRNGGGAAHSSGDFGNRQPVSQQHWPPLEENQHCDDDFDDHVIGVDLDENEELIKAVTNLRMRDLQNHIRMLNSSSSSHHNKKPKNSAVEQQLKAENSKLKLAYENQQGQIQQLTQSLNQCFQALLTIQRDVATLQQKIDQQQQSQQHHHSTPKETQQNNHMVVEDNMDSVSQQRDFDNPIRSWDFDFTRHHSSESTTRPSNVDPWNNYFAESRLMTAAVTTGSESGMSTGALNNTVPPGIRANNYWDNFRSFSRQNRLQTSNLVGHGGLSPVVAQVTPRQVQPTLHLPHSPIRNHPNNSNATHHSDPIIFDNSDPPYFSTGRPRRKQKINREHNVNSAGSQRPEAAMVFPMPQQQAEHHQHVHHPPRQNQVQPYHQQLLNPMVTSIKRSIYNHVNDLIAQNEERPEQLARIFHDLQNINNRTTHEINQQANNQADTTTETVSRSLNRPSWGSSMYDGVQDEPDEDENDVSSSSFFKAAGNKKFNPVEHLASEIVNSSGGSSLFQGEDEMPPMFAFETSSNPGLDSLASLGAVGGLTNSENTNGAGGSGGSAGNKKVNEEGGGGISSQKPQNVVAVPKNIQRNIISRERDERRKVRRTENKPRNMMNEMVMSSMEGGQLQVNPLAFNNDSHNTHQLNDLNTTTQSDMAEADQLQIPDSAVDQTFDLQPLEVGLDRVPTRLSSSDLDARRQEEEDNLQNLVDEVLNSSSEADFVHGATDQLPSPK